MEQAETEILVGELDVRIDRLRALYDQYFSGLEKLEPLVPRKDVERRLDTLRREQIRNTGLRFRFQTLVQRYNTYQTHWQRICRQIEIGTYKRDVLRAKARFGSLVPGQAGPTSRVQNGDTQPAPAPESGFGEEFDAESAWTGAGLDDLDASLDDAFNNTPPRRNGDAPRGWTALRPPAVPDDALDDAPLSSLDPIPSSLLRDRVPDPGSSVHPRAPSSQPGSPAPRSILPRPSFGSLPPLGSAPPAPNAAARATTQMTGKKIVIQRTGASLPPPAPPPPAAIAPQPRTLAPPPVAAPSLPSRAPPPLPSRANAGRTLPPPLPVAASVLRDAPAPVLRQASPPTASPPADEGGLPSQRVREIYGKYVETRRAHGESTANITIDGLARTLRETSSKVREKVGGDRAVDFEVQVKDGKTVLKPIVK